MELVFSPFDLETIDVRYREASYGRAVAHIITRHTHPKARPETPEPPPAATGIDYLALTAATHHEQIRADHRIGYNALFTTTPASGNASGSGGDGQILGQLSIDDLDGPDGLAGLDQQDGVSA